MHWQGGQSLRRIVPDYAVSFGLGGCVCQKRYIISVVGVGNSFYWVPSASFLCQLEIVFFHFINRCSKHPKIIFEVDVLIGPATILSETIPTIKKHSTKNYWRKLFFRKYNQKLFKKIETIQTQNLEKKHKPKLFLQLNQNKKSNIKKQYEIQN